MELNTILFAFGLTVFAGLSTGIGSAMAFFSKRTNPAFLSGALGFSAGVMIYVSLVEIFVKANDALTSSLGDKTGYMVTTLSFFGGIALIALIDKLVPSFENPHELHDGPGRLHPYDRTRSADSGERPSGHGRKRNT